MTLARAPVPLGGPARVALSIEHHYRVIRPGGKHGPYKVQTAAYYYAIDDHAGREIVAYHWHPDVRQATGVRAGFPHLHVNRGIVRLETRLGLTLTTSENPLRLDAAQAHFPTARIALEDVIELAIRDFGVSHRANALLVLSETRAAFERNRTW